MSSVRYHDAIVVGSAPGGFLLAGLLARRGLDVALVGQQDPGPRFWHQQLELPACSSWLPPVESSPVVDRVLGELGLEDGVHRLDGGVSRQFCIIGPDVRLDFGPGSEERARELVRTGLAEPHLVEKALERLDATAGTCAAIFERTELLLPGNAWQRLQARRRWRQLSGETLGDLPTPLDWLLDAVHFFTNMRRDNLPVVLQARWLSVLARGMRSIPDLFQRLKEACRRAGCEVLDEAVAREVRPWGKGGVEVSFTADSRPRRAALVVLAVPLDQAQELLALGGGRRRLQAAAAHVRHVASTFVLDLVLPVEKLPLGLGDTCLLLPEDGETTVEKLVLLKRLPVAGRRGRQVVQLYSYLPTSQRYLGRRVLVEHQERLLEKAGRIIPFLTENLEFATSPFWQERSSDHPHPDPWHLHPIYESDVEMFTGSSLGTWWGPRRQVTLAGPEVAPALGFEGAALQALHLAEVITARRKRRRH